MPSQCQGGFCCERKRYTWVEIKISLVGSGQESAIKKKGKSETIWHK